MSRAVPWSSPWYSPVRWPGANFAAWGPGSPGVHWAGLECRNQRGVVAWCPGAPVDRVVGPGERGARPVCQLRPPGLWGPQGGVRWRHGRVAALVRCLWVVYGCLRLGCIFSMVGGAALGVGVVWVRGRSLAGSGSPGPHFGWVFPGVSLVRPLLVPGRLAVEGFCGVPHAWGYNCNCVLPGCCGGCGGSRGRGLCLCRWWGLQWSVVCCPRRFLLAVRRGGLWRTAPGRVWDMWGWDGWGGGCVCGRCLHCVLRFSGL